MRRTRSATVTPANEGNIPCKFLSATTTSTRLSGVEKEDAARGHLPGDEAAAVLRKTVRAVDAREGRGGAPRPQARAQAGAARGPHCRSEEEGLAGKRARGTTRNGWGCGCASSAARSILRSREPGPRRRFMSLRPACASNRHVPMTIYKCPHCRTEYGLIMARLSFRQRSYANCQVCHKTMYSWNGSNVPRFTLVRRSDAITPAAGAAAAPRVPR